MTRRLIPTLCDRRPACRALSMLTLGLALAAAPQAARAQPLPFGSADDPREEVQRYWWRPESTLDVMGGLSLIGAQWRAAGGFGLNFGTPSLTARLSGTLRAGIYGEYQPDLDESYDVIRLVEFVRFSAPARYPFYLRAGPLTRTRLGTGHIVDFFSSAVAVDERTVGLELMQRWPLLDLAGFTDNVLLNGVTGGRTALRPFYRARPLYLQSLTLGFNYTTDLATRTSLVRDLSAYNVEVSLSILQSGDILLTPFASYGRYLGYGSGISIGADLESYNFIDLGRFNLRIALYYNGRQFIPGYFGSFYQVSNPLARICNSDRYFAEEERCQSLEGVPLQAALGGNDLLTELRLLIFRRIELWYYFRRHYGRQSLSEHHLRLFAQAPGRFRFDVGIDRGGLRGLFSLLNDLGDQTGLVFGTDYRFASSFWVFIRARYSFEHIGEAPDGTARYLIQRRFEPFTGLRLSF